MIQPTPFSSPIGAPIAAALDWWREAGVDCDFADVPRQWLADRPDPNAVQQRPATPLPAAFTEAIAAAAAAPDTTPSDEEMRIGAKLRPGLRIWRRSMHGGWPNLRWTMAMSKDAWRHAAGSRRI
jgi:hypothetical protein